MVVVIIYSTHSHVRLNVYLLRFSTKKKKKCPFNSFLKKKKKKKFPTANTQLTNLILTKKIRKKKSKKKKIYIYIYIKEKAVGAAKEKRRTIYK